MAGAVQSQEEDTDLILGQIRKTSHFTAVSGTMSDSGCCCLKRKDKRRVVLEGNKYANRKGNGQPQRKRDQKKKTLKFLKRNHLLSVGRSEYIL